MTNETQQTAVEQLAQELLTKYHIKIDAYPEFKQAKEMEKEQMIEFYVKGCDDTRKINENYGLEYDKTYGLHFYNETYGDLK